MKKIIFIMVVALFSMSSFSTEISIEKHRIDSLKLSHQDIFFQFYDIKGETAGRDAYISFAVGVSPLLKISSKNDLEKYFEVKLTKTQTHLIDLFFEHIKKSEFCVLDYTITITNEEFVKLSQMAIRCEN